MQEPLNTPPAEPHKELANTEVSMSESKAGVAEEPGGTQLEIINALLEGPREQSDGSATDKESAQATIVTYLMANVEEFRQLMGLRKQGWDSPEADRHFEERRQDADNADEERQLFFYAIMKKVAAAMHFTTGAFTIARETSDEPSILSLCTAPGGFLATSMKMHPTAHALAFSLPTAQGGYKVQVPDSPKLDLRFVDVTMLAEDLGVTQIPADHPDAKSFLLRQIPREQLFDLVFCEGRVVRKHLQTHAENRALREKRRLECAQLALALEHLRDGGTMVVVAGRIESMRTLSILHTLQKFSSVTLYKHPRYHAQRSSFYMVAANVRVQHPVAVHALQMWKSMWRVATFGDEEAYQAELAANFLDMRVFLRDFGDELVRLGRKIWETQAEALSQATYVKTAAPKKQDARWRSLSEGQLPEEEPPTKQDAIKAPWRSLSGNKPEDESPTKQHAIKAPWRSRSGSKPEEDPAKKQDATKLSPGKPWETARSWRKGPGPFT